MLSLIEEIEQKVDKEKAEKLVKKIQKGKGFDLEDFVNNCSKCRVWGSQFPCWKNCPA